MSFVLRGFAFACLLTLAACSTVPSLDEATGGIPIREIVVRVKCELADSFDQKVQDPHFRWLADWTAKVDLTLQADAQGTLSPGASFINPYEQVRAVGRPFNTDFTLGASAKYDEKATRTEIISFSLSLKELKAWKRAQKPECEPAGRQLAGGLGLKEWIDAALEPVAFGDLTAGDHPAPASAKSGGRPSGGAKPRAFSAMSFKVQAENAAAQAKKHADDTQKSADAAEISWKNASAAVTKAEAPYSAVLDPSYRRASVAFVNAAQSQYLQAQKLADRAQKDAREAQTEAAGIAESDTSDAARAAAERAKKLAVDAEAAASDAKSQATAAEQNNKLAQQREPNPPIDSISHAVVFTVAYGAGVTPTWNLVHFKGMSGNLASVNGVRTHTLNIALGPRDTQVTSPEAARMLNTLAIQQSRSGQ